MGSRRRWSIRSHVLAAPATVLLVLVGVVAVAVSTFDRLEATVTAEAHASALRLRVAEVRRLAIDLETGVRGYMLTGDRAFLEPYERASRELPAQLDAFEAESGAHHAEARRVREALADWQASVAEPEMELVRTGGDAAAFVSTGAGKTRMDRIRAELGALDTQVASDLATRLEADADARRWMRTGIAVATLLGIGGTAVIGVGAARRTAAPTEALAAAAHRVAAGDYRVDLPAEGPRELVSTADAFRRMAAALAAARDTLEAQNRALAEQAEIAEAARTELAAELARAGRVQADLLPGATPPSPGLEVRGSCIQARAAGGDFYDWIPAGGDVVAVIGDVMGKGMEAALWMATIRAALRVSLPRLGPAEALAATAEALGPDLSRAGIFVTLFVVRVSPGGRVRYVDAGHGLAVLRGPDGHVEQPVERGLPLGILPRDQWTEGYWRLPPGGSLVAVSDGALELDTEGVPEHLARTAAEYGTESACAWLEHAATRRADRADDVTAIVIRRAVERET